MIKIIEDIEKNIEKIKKEESRNRLLLIPKRYVDLWWICDELIAETDLHFLTNYENIKNNKIMILGIIKCEDS